MSERPSRRRKLVVDKSLQWRMIFEQAWPAALAMLVTATVMCFFVARVAQESLAASVELPSLIWVVATALAFVLVSSAFIVIAALRFSHRVAGPIYGIRKVLSEFREGDTSARVNLRSRDFLTDLTEDLNELLDSVELARESDPSQRADSPADACSADSSTVQ